MSLIRFLRRFFHLNGHEALIARQTLAHARVLSRASRALATLDEYETAERRRLSRRRL